MHQWAVGSWCFEAAHSPHLQRLIGPRETCWPLKLKVMLWNDIYTLLTIIVVLVLERSVSNYKLIQHHVPEEHNLHLWFYLVSANCCREWNSTGEMLPEWCEDPTYSSDKDSLCESDRGHLVCCRWTCCWKGMILTFCLPFASI